MTQSMLTTFGALRLPAVADSTNGTAASLDPGRDQLLEFFRAVIVSEFGEAWRTIAAGLGAGHPLGKQTEPVAFAYPDEPTAQVLTQAKFPFPLLALHREGAGTFGDFTLERDRLQQNWALHYILGPLDVIDSRKLKDFCIAVPKALRNVIRQRKHMSYEGGALQFFGNTSAFGAIDLVGFQRGNARFAGGDDSTLYYACEMTLQTIEYSDYIEGSEESDLTGLDVAVGVGDEDEIAPDLILGST